MGGTINSTIKLGHIVPVENVVVEFGENKKGYVGGYIMLNGEETQVIFTPRELELALSRARREQDNFCGIEVKRTLWEKIKRYFSLHEA